MSSFSRYVFYLALPHTFWSLESMFSLCMSVARQYFFTLKLRDNLFDSNFFTFHSSNFFL